MLLVSLSLKFCHLSWVWNFHFQLYFIFLKTFFTSNLKGNIRKRNPIKALISYTKVLIALGLYFHVMYINKCSLLMSTRVNNLLPIFQKKRKVNSLQYQTVSLKMLPVN